MVYAGLRREDGVPLQEDVLEQLRRRGDSVADALVLAFRAERGIDELENLLVQLFRWPPSPLDPKRELPGPFLAFLMAAEQLPDWFEAEGGWPRVARGQALYARYHLTALLILGCASLPQCYANSEIAGALIMSGRLAAQVQQRLGETATFLDSTMQPRALLDPGDGLRWIRKVRLIHAVMRVLIEADPAEIKASARTGSAGEALRRINWRKRSASKPIDQLEMAFVLLTFSLVVIDGWRSLGISPSKQDSDDYMFTWALIGHMLGVEPVLLEKCRSLADARQLALELKPLQEKRSLKAIRAGRLLSAALLVLLRERVVGGAPVPAWLRWVLPSLPHSLIRRLVGRRTAGALWVERAPLLPRLVHWALIRFGAFSKPGASTDYGRGMGMRFQQEFCVPPPLFRQKR